MSILTYGLFLAGLVVYGFALKHWDETLSDIGNGIMLGNAVILLLRIRHVLESRPSTGTGTATTGPGAASGAE